MLDPDTAPLLELDRELTRLQRRYHVASHEVGELGVRPDGIDDTLAWWIAAHRAKWRRRLERSETIRSRNRWSRSNCARTDCASHRGSSDVSMNRTRLLLFPLGGHGSEHGHSPRR